MKKNKDIDLIDVLNHHLAGGKFEYKSFDFKKAAAEYEKSKEWEDLCSINDSFSPIGLELKDKYQIPEEIREKYAYWRTGKLRNVEFSPSGAIRRVYIGAKYSISFYWNNLESLRLITPENAPSTAPQVSLPAQE